REQRPVRCGIDDDSLELLAEHAALLVLLVDQEKDRILQRGLADGHGAGKRMQDADLDGVVRGFGRGKWRGRQAKNEPRGGREPATAAQRRSMVNKVRKHEMSSP